jgi:hypothetical protein
MGHEEGSFAVIISLNDTYKISRVFSVSKVELSLINIQYHAWIIPADSEESAKNIKLSVEQDLIPNQHELELMESTLTIWRAYMSTRLAVRLALQSMQMQEMGDQ